jgi:predicted DNA-binding ribbon-helix-helix protein
MMWLMAAVTATIRVTRDTRDRLAAQARERGISLAALLAEVAEDREAELALRSEREASLRDAASGASDDEDRLWQSAALDGLD